MMNLFYCKLYIDSGEEISDLQTEVDDLVRELFCDIEVESPIFKNDNFTDNVDPYSEFYPIERSRFYAEIDSEQKDETYLRGFQLGVASLVQSLREKGRFVVASCDFEDLIDAETGWNWTQDNPLQPN